MMTPVMPMHGGNSSWRLSLVPGRNAPQFPLPELRIKMGLLDPRSKHRFNVEGNPLVPCTKNVIVVSQLRKE